MLKKISYIFILCSGLAFSQEKQNVQEVNENLKYVLNNLDFTKFRQHETSKGEIIRVFQIIKDEYALTSEE